MCKVTKKKLIRKKKMRNKDKIKQFLQTFLIQQTQAFEHLNQNLCNILIKKLQDYVRF